MPTVEQMIRATARVLGGIPYWVVEKDYASGCLLCGFLCRPPRGYERRGPHRQKNPYQVCPQVLGSMHAENKKQVLGRESQDFPAIQRYWLEALPQAFIIHWE